jgi:hypothetical protein
LSAPYNPIAILAACKRFVFYKIGYEKSTSIGMEDQRDNKMAQSSLKVNHKEFLMVRLIQSCG